jgi:WD40 repeat protein
MALLAGFAWKKKGEAEELQTLAEAAQAGTEEARRDAADRRDAARLQALIAGSRALVSSGEPSWAVELLRMVNNPEETPGFVEVANEVLERRPPWATFRGRMATPSPDGRWLATAEWHGGTLYIHRIDHQGSPVVVPTGPEPATNLAWSPDGGRLAATFRDGAIRVVDPTSGEIVSLRDGREGDIVTRPVFSADGRFFAAISSDKARLWTGGLAEIATFGEDVSDVQISPDGRYVLVINKSSRVELWTLDPDVTCKGAKQGPRPCRVKVLADSAAAASFSHTSWRVSIMKDSYLGEVALETWSPEDWTNPRTDNAIPEHDLDDLTDLLEVLPLDGEAWLFLAGGRSKLLHDHKWRELPGSEPATASRDVSRVAVTRDTGVRVVDVVDVAPSSPMIELWSQSGIVNDVVFGPDGRWIVTSSLTRGTSRLFRLGAGPSGVALASDSGDYEEYGGNEPKLSASADIGVASSRDGGVYVWDLKGGIPPKLVPGARPRLSEDGRHVVTIKGGNALVTATAPPYATKKIRPDGCDVVDAALRSEPTGDNRLVVVCADGTVRSASAADADDSRVLAPMDCPGESVSLLSETGRSALLLCEGSDSWAFSIDRGLIQLPPACPAAAKWVIAPDGVGIACFALDEVVFLELDQPASIRSWREPGVLIDGVTWSPDAQTAAVTTTDSAVHVFRLGPGANFEHLALTGHTQLVHSVSFDRTGLRMATASWDGLRVFSLDRDEPPLSLGHRTAPNELTRVALSEDGREVLFMGGDGVVRRYSLSAGDLRSRLEDVTTDCLPAEVRRAYAGETAEEAEKAEKACECKQGRCNQGR